MNFFVDATTSNVSFDKVTASKSSESLRAIHLTIQPCRSTRCNKGGEQSRAGEKQNQKEESEGEERENSNVR